MRANFDNKLSELNKKLLSMAAMTEQIIAMSIKSLEEQNTKLARETVEFDAKINEAERERGSVLTCSCSSSLFLPRISDVCPLHLK